MVTRTCTVPSGKAILFPIINAECSQIEGNGNTQQELSKCAKDLIDAVTTVTATVDGVDLQDLTTPNSPYRVQSPLFTFNACKITPLASPQGRAHQCLMATGFSWPLYLQVNIQFTFLERHPPSPLRRK